MTSVLCIVILTWYNCQLAIFLWNCSSYAWWLRQQRVCLQCRRLEFDPWVGKIPWRRKWLLTPVFLPGEFHGQRSLGATVHGAAKSWTWLSDFHFPGVQVSKFCITKYVFLSFMVSAVYVLACKVFPPQHPCSFFSVSLLTSCLLSVFISQPPESSVHVWCEVREWGRLFQDHSYKTIHSPPTCGSLNAISPLGNEV